MATPRDMRRKMASRTRTARLGTTVAGGRGSAGLRAARDWSVLLPDTAWPVGTPPPATEGEALALPPFGRGVALLANTVAATDWHAQRWDGDLGVAVRLPDQPSVVTDPNPLSTGWHYRWAATEDGVLYGNHFALLGDLDYRTLRPGWVLPLLADEVWLVTNTDRSGWYSWAIGGEVFTPDELLHVSYGNRSGEVLGRGALGQYAESLGGYVAAERHAAGYFAGGAMPPAVLQSPTVVEQEQADELKAKWRTLTATREPVILPMGYVLTPVVTDAEKSQLVQSRTWDAELVSMMLGIPPWKLGLAGPTMTYQNVETADIDFVRDSADRYAQPLAQAFTKWLMPRGTAVVFDYADRMRADQRTTADVLAAYVGANIISTDEARAVIGRPPAATTDQAATTPEGVPELTPTDVTT